MTLETIQKTREYLDYVEEHVNNVLKAFNIVSEKCNRVINIDWVSLYNSIQNHDLSKLSQAEFIPYRSIPLLFLSKYISLGTYIPFSSLDSIIGCRNSFISKYC